jgi:Spy/CpxP family protein refolding chaperone
MRMTRYYWIVPALMAVLGTGRWASAQNERDLRPEVGQLVQSVAEKLESVGDKLGLTDDQRAKIRDIHATFAEKYKERRAERRDLLRSEMTALGAILTPEQREKVKDFAEDRMEARKTEAAERDWPHFAEMRDTIRERIQGAGASLGLTDEQRKQIRAAWAPFAEKCRAEREQRRDLVEAEFKAIAATLTPEQQRMAREAIEEPCVRAQLAAAVAERLDAAADSLGLNSDQRQRIVAAHRPFAAKYRALRDERRELLRDELKAIGAVLTPAQREKVKDFAEDRVVVIAVVPDENAWAEARKHLRENMAERLETVGDKLGLTDDQRAKIRDIHDTFAEKFKDQRAQRKALRQEELNAMNPILTSAQRDKVEDFVEDRVESAK